MPGKRLRFFNNLASQPGVGSTGHPLLTVREEIKSAHLILITGDRGLAGAYNANIVARAEKFIQVMDVPVTGSHYRP